MAGKGNDLKGELARDQEAICIHDSAAFWDIQNG